MAALINHIMAASNARHRPVTERLFAVLGLIPANQPRRNASSQPGLHCPALNPCPVLPFTCSPLSDSSYLPLIGNPAQHDGGPSAPNASRQPARRRSRSTLPRGLLIVPSCVSSSFCLPSQLGGRYRSIPASRAAGELQTRRSGLTMHLVFFFWPVFHLPLSPLDRESIRGEHCGALTRTLHHATSIDS